MRRLCLLLCVVHGATVVAQDLPTPSFNSTDPVIVNATDLHDTLVGPATAAANEKHGMSTTVYLGIVGGAIACLIVVAALLFAILHTRPRDDDSMDGMDDDLDNLRFTSTAKCTDFNLTHVTSGRTSALGSDAALMSLRSDIESAMNSLRSDPGLRSSRVSVGSRSARSSGVGIAMRVPSLLDINPEVYSANPELRQAMNQYRQDVLDMYGRHETTV
ncbi:hypothetical protein AeMF1_012819 [Aphanomyces euteiches]|nr:hypothetical protein AeMF1_012819 [Aphanomyces euteiches]KAH9185343.1 hypothetical protein AeNC1_012681 [Aphanomyces euteiches]